MAAALFEDDYLEEEKVADRGDLVEFDRGLYKHYGVAVDSKHVVHLTSADPGSSRCKFSCAGPKAEVKKERISQVAWGNRYSVLKKREQEEACRNSNSIICDAEDMVGMKMSYNLLEKNCEHFARNLVFGVPKCKQVAQAADKAKIASFFGIMFVAALAIFRIVRG
nr:phospholipase A and acyltransferase 4-like [Anolis sagrei ordinatus]